MTKPQLFPGQFIDGRYVVERLVGRGGMAAVYRVRHTTLGTPFALKLIEVPHQNVRERLLVEGRVQSSIHHPNVVLVTDTVVVEGSPGLVMEFVAGPTLADLIDDRLTLAQVDDLAAGIFSGVEAAHRAGIVHRDLKPHNVLIEVGEHRFVPKLADFGLVKVLTEDAPVPGGTLTGVAFGTPEYMAPEQMRDAKTVDPRADIWSLGALLYEMLTGMRAFTGTDVLDTMVRASKGIRIPIRDIIPELPGRMADAIDLALIVEREERAQSVGELRAAWFAGAPSNPENPWLAEQLERFRVAAAPEVTRLPTLPASGGGVTVPGRDEVTMQPMDRGPATHPADAQPAAPEVVVAPPSEQPMPAVVGRVAVDRSVTGSAVAVVLAALTVLFVVWKLLNLAPPVEPAAVRPLPTPVVPTPRPEVPTPPPTPAPTVATPLPHPVPRPPPPPVPVPVVPAPVPETPAPVVLASPPAVTVSGADGLTVVLRDATSGETVSPREARPGTWEVVVFFEPRVPSVVGRVSLREGSVVGVRCSASAHRCAIDGK